MNGDREAPARDEVFASVPLALIAFSRTLGLSTAELLAAARLTADDLRDPDGYVDYESLPRIWTLLIERFPDRALGLEYAQMMRLEVLGVVGGDSTTREPRFPSNSTRCGAPGPWRSFAALSSRWPRWPSCSDTQIRAPSTGASAAGPGRARSNFAHLAPEPRTDAIGPRSGAPSRCAGQG